MGKTKPAKILNLSNMALQASPPDLEPQSGSNKGNYLIPFILVTTLFFLWGLANSLNGTLVKQFQVALDLQRWQANIVETAFYLGYFAFAIPAGLVMQKLGYKKGIVLGLLLYAAGAFLFYPAANVREYGVFLLALFTIASGLAFLETAANLYVTILGDPKKGDFRLNLAQSFNGLSVILGPVIGGFFIFSEKEYSSESLASMPIAEAEAIRSAHALSVQAPYLWIGALVLLIAFLFVITPMPEVQSKSDAKGEAAGTGILSLLKHKHLSLGILAQFLYIGGQTSLWGNFVDIKLDLARDSNLALVNQLYGVTEQMSATQIASFHASFALVFFMLGRFVGTYFMGKYASHKVLGWYAWGAVISLVLAIWGGGLLTVIALMATYFFQSIMFPTIFALACKNLGESSKLASSLVIMSIVGGSIIPPITAYLFKIGPQTALMVPLACFAYVVFYAFKGSQMIKT